MSPPRKKVILGVISFITLTSIFSAVFFFHSLIEITAKELPHFVLLSILVNILMIFVWFGLGRIAGIITTIFILWMVPVTVFEEYTQIASFYVISCLTAAAAGYYFYRKFFLVRQRFKVDNEKQEERQNIIKNDLAQNSRDIVLLENRLKRYLKLSELAEIFSSTIKEQEITDLIIESAYGIFNKSDRVLFYRVDTSKQELALVSSKKGDNSHYIRSKKGDMFDRWIFWKKQPLIVEDVKKDFRFSLDEKKYDGSFNSLIGAPLVSREKILGILRLDSVQANAYTQEDLRLLDIIAGIASVTFQNSLLYKHLNDLAITDGLTGLYVNKFFKDTLKNETQRYLKTKVPFSVVLMDVDNFKDFNDEYGHIAGDLVLRHISRIIKKCLNEGDMASRYGGEEFAFLLLGKNKKEAFSVADEVRKNIEISPVRLRRKKTYITVSMGVSTCPDDSVTQDELFNIADKLLYKAKRKGKNQICAN